jgi:hypothetical protein
MVSSTQLLRVGFVAAEPCQATLDKLQGDVPWSATGSAWCTVGCLWIPSPAFVFLALNIDWLITLMAQCGRVVQSACGVDRSLGNVFNGVVHLTMKIPPDSYLPSFIDHGDTGGHLAVVCVQGSAQLPLL